MSPEEAQEWIAALNPTERELIQELASQLAAFCLGQILFEQELQDLKAGEKTVRKPRHILSTTRFLGLLRGGSFQDILQEAGPFTTWHDEPATWAIHHVRNYGLILRTSYRSKLETGEVSIETGILHASKFYARYRRTHATKEERKTATARAIAMMRELEL